MSTGLYLCEQELDWSLLGLKKVKWLESFQWGEMIFKRPSGWCYGYQSILIKTSFFPGVG
jgi:hypothetical protein